MILLESTLVEPTNFIPWLVVLNRRIAMQYLDKYGFQLNKNGYYEKTIEDITCFVKLSSIELITDKDLK